MKFPFQRFNLEVVDGTNLWVLADDNAACSVIRRERRLDWDEGFRNLAVIKALTSADVVFDVGAFVGDSTAVFLAQGCEVHAFEPRQDTYVCLLQNCPQAHCYNVALGDHERYSVTEGTGNIGGQPLLPGRRYAIALDALRVERVSFLKIDVEGMEACVLRGARETLTRLHPTIHIEFNPFVLAQFADTAESLEALLRDLGYASLQEVYRHSGPHGDHWDVVCT